VAAFCGGLGLGLGLGEALAFAGDVARLLEQLRRVQHVLRRESVMCG
jgi:hypothetical protein